MVNLSFSIALDSCISKEDLEENKEQLREQLFADYYSVGINTDFRDELYDRIVYVMQLLRWYRGW